MTPNIDFSFLFSQLEIEQSLVIVGIRDAKLRFNVL
jgi:hypothetical protein